jgi:putative membrane protein
MSAALAWAIAARAESAADYGNPPAAAVAPPGSPDLPTKPQARARVPLFAAASAASSRPMAPQQREEWRFLKDAAAASRFQADAARMALARSNAPVVRSLAATLLDQQAANGGELVRLLHQRGMAPPMLANSQRKVLNRLTRLQGPRFDREFLAQVALKSQQGEVLEYEKAAATIADPDLKAWIEQALPSLRYRLATAERMAQPNLRSARRLAAASRHQPPGAPRPVATRPSEWNSR